MQQIDFFNQKSQALKPTLYSFIFCLLLITVGCKKKQSAGNSSTQPPITVNHRDKYLWPFSATSIWNMPIGANAVYVPAGLPPAQYTGIDQEWHIFTKNSDPVRDILAPSSWSQRWPGGAKLGTCPVPDDLIIPDAAPPNTPNACAAFILPDGNNIRQLEPACRKVAGSTQIVGYLWGTDENLYGDGIGGSHWGSGLSAFGGSIRKGELVGTTPIKHSLKINVWGKHLFYDVNSVKGFRWPANRSDSYASTGYNGTNPKLVMGSLLAIPPSYTIEGVSITTHVGKKLFTALQDYGAYITDDTGWNAYDWCVSRDAYLELKSLGVDIAGSSNDYFKDMMKIISILHIVDNNSKTTVGGGGTPRQPLAPAFSN